MTIAVDNGRLRENGETVTVATRRQFIDGPYGQMHVRVTASTANPPDEPALVLFHPTPASGRYFSEYAALMATDRPVIAIDTPGYGDSEGPREPPTISHYANAAATALGRLGYGQDDRADIDVLGFHTGGLIAVELARTNPGLVRRLVLPGLPFFSAAARAAMYEQTAVPDPRIERDGAHLDAVWEHATIAVDAGVPLERAQELYIEELKAFPDSWWGYRAAFTYDSERCCAEVRQPVLLLSTAGGLEDETRAATEVFPDATYVHLPDLSYGAFMLGAAALAAESRRFLDR